MDQLAHEPMRVSDLAVDPYLSVAIPPSAIGPYETFFAIEAHAVSEPLQVFAVAFVGGDSALGKRHVCSRVDC